MSIKKCCECRTDAGPTGPVGSRLGHLGVGIVGSADVEVTGEARQSGGEDESLGPQRPHRPTHEVQVDAGVGLHGSRDVGDENDPPGTLGVAPMNAAHRITTRAMRPAQCCPDIQTAPL